MPEDPTRPDRPSEGPGEPTAGGAGGRGSGLEPNVAGALSYLLGPITGVLFLLLDRDRPFVRFHAAQCLVLTVAAVVLGVVLAILGIVLGMVPVLGWIVNILLSLAVWLLFFFLWLYLMYQAFQGVEWEVPALGEYARQLASRI